jgi:hypothetical protein
MDCGRLVIRSIVLEQIEIISIQLRLFLALGAPFAAEKGV